ncbi:hypothetical protein L208DRAFT_1409420 [Tricholoma matsutake]|nr:hypothetical protein L208DRAFT_1409420 [Tricholoma matsutake 945]
MGSVEAAAYATSIFLEIALQAQSRKCRLHPTQYPTSSVAVMDPLSDSSVTKPLASRPLDRPSISTEKQAQDEIRALKTELEKQKQRMVSRPEATANKATSAPRSLKGASLANPNKKARKYEAIEFESDEE